MNNPYVRAVLVAALASIAVHTASADAIVPPKVIQTFEPRFPAALELTTVSSGTAELLMTVDSTGKLVDVLVIGYSHKEFGRTAVETVREWRYEPALRDGQPIESRMRLSLTFRSNMRVFTLMASETPDVLIRRASGLERLNLVSNAEDLDRPLEVLHPATPVHPGRATPMPEGQAVLDFFVDETGRARVPVVVGTTHPSFSSAAMDALEDWRFAVPTRRGRPTIVRMRQTFVFSGGT
jgi:TonB family protein